MIKEYHFGSITINGKTYTYDVEVKTSGQVLEWRRKESHVIDVEAVKRAVEEKPDIIIIGTGESGIGRITESAKQFITKNRIKLIINITGQAVEAFNEQAKKQTNVIGLFHLTC